MDSISPFEKGKHKQAECDSTVAVPNPPPPPCWAALCSVRLEGGRGGETDSVHHFIGRCTGYRSSPFPKSVTIIIVLKGAKDVLPFYPGLLLETSTCTLRRTNTKTTAQKPNTFKITKMSDVDEKRKKQKQGRTLVYVKGKTYGSKSESSSRAKKHKGNPKPPKGVWVSPEREREKKKHGVDEQTKQKRRGGTQTGNQTQVGS